MLTKRQKDFLEAAIRIVTDEGLSRLTIRNVAAAVGVTEPAVYRHFPSKLALLTALIEDLHEAILPHFKKLNSPAVSSSMEQLLRAFITGLFDELNSRPTYAVFFFSEEAFHADPQLKPLLQNIMQETLRVLTESFSNLQNHGLCRKDISSSNLAKTTMGSIRLSIAWWHLGRGGKEVSPELPELAEELIRTLSTLFKFR
jgi:AcrR family transcriptional regulator